MLRIVVALAFWLVTVGAAHAQAVDPIGVVMAYQDGVNAGDVDAVLAQFADDAERNVDGQTYTGTNQIRTLVEMVVANHAHLEPGNFEVNGNRVTWTLKLTNDTTRRLDILPLDQTNVAMVHGGKLTVVTSAVTPESAARLQAAQARAAAPVQLPRTGGAGDPPATATPLGAALVLVGLVVRWFWHPTQDVPKQDDENASAAPESSPAELASAASSTSCRRFSSPC